MSTPTLGYPTRTEAVVALREKGVSISDIAAQMGIAKSTVSALYCFSRGTRKRVKSSPFGRIEVPREMLENLVSHAKKRHVNVNRLATMIIRAVVEGSLVDAVLDDGASP